MSCSKSYCFEVVKCRCSLLLILIATLLVAEIDSVHGVETKEEIANAFKEVLFLGKNAWHLPGYSHITLEEWLANKRGQKLLGKGSHNKVYLVQHPSPPHKSSSSNAPSSSPTSAVAEYYALREDTDPFSDIYHADNVAADLVAQRLANNASHGWLAPAVAQFISPSNNSLYSVMCLLPGRTLARVRASVAASVAAEKTTQPVETVFLTPLEECFYRTEKIIALGKFHSICANAVSVYYDVREENTALDQHGHLVLIDYGIASLYPTSPTNDVLRKRQSLLEMFKERWGLGYYGAGNKMVHDLPTAERDWEQLADNEEEIVKSVHSFAFEDAEKEFINELYQASKSQNTADDLLLRSTHVKKYVELCYNNLSEKGYIHSSLDDFYKWLQAMKEKSPLLTVPFLPGVAKGDKAENFKLLSEHTTAAAAADGELIATHYRRQFTPQPHPIVKVVGEDVN